MRLRDALDTPAKAEKVAVRTAAERDKERARVRAKFSESDRAFMDEIRGVFPSARLVYVKFSDGEQIGEAI
jgi:hypothetical protein